ncbi:MAG: Rrf2 family transcriptional regulator [Arenicella sp.]
MKLTAKGRYAVTAMMDLALQTKACVESDQVNSDELRVALTDIADRQHISLSYLEQLFANLRKANLVTAVRGPGGGYSLAKNSHDISVAEILAAVDENLDLTCGNGSSCGGDHDPCLTHGLWSNLSAELHRFLHEKTLAEVIKQPTHYDNAAKQQSQKFSGIPIELS